MSTAERTAAEVERLMNEASELVKEVGSLESRLWGLQHRLACLVDDLREKEQPCEVCGQPGQKIKKTGSLGILDGRFCSAACIQYHINSK